MVLAGLYILDNPGIMASIETAKLYEEISMTRMDKEKPTKLYNLFYHNGKLTTLSRYCDWRKTVFFVAAKSIQQAYYLASNDIWFSGKTGILQQGAGLRWVDYQGKITEHPTYQYGGARPLPKSFFTKQDKNQEQQQDSPLP